MTDREKADIDVLVHLLKNSRANAEILCEWELTLRLDRAIVAMSTPTNLEVTQHDD